MHATEQRVEVTVVLEIACAYNLSSRRATAWGAMPMLLVSAKVGPFKSIDQPHEVLIDEKITVLVGMNEAGKTVFLQALQKSSDVLGEATFDPVDDYPRKNLTTYQKRHATDPDPVTVLTYQLSDKEVQEINDALSLELPAQFQFSVTHFYDNDFDVEMSVDEKPVINLIAARPELSPHVRDAIRVATSLEAIPGLLTPLARAGADDAVLAEVQGRIQTAAAANWSSAIRYELWQALEPKLPGFLYFGDYEVLPSKMNLNDLKQRYGNAKKQPSGLTPEHRGVLALLRMADISLKEFADPGALEPLIARIEAVSINLTDQIMEFWKQNEDLEVKIDIRTDASDQPPFNDGPNLYIRIANKRHRGVTTPFKQRSRGFIWFFSFLVWFDEVQNQLANADSKKSLILLLDEPGLSLHALAQEDFLKYIDNLAERHQVLYTTHSPFMIHSDRLHQVRVVEDRDKVGTVISDNISGSNSRTVFPLQAALGWTVAQNLFISKRNLLVEGPADLIYLQTMSSLLEASGRAGLREGITIVPTGGLDKVMTFVALLGANALEMAVLHDYRGAPEQKLLDLIRQKMISAKAVMDASQFRDLTQLGVSGKPSDTEDLLDPDLYLQYFNRAYATKLGGAELKVADLPPGDRIVERIEAHLADKNVQLRPSGGFNHYLPAREFAAKPPSTLDPDTVGRFEALFKAVDALFS